MRLVREVQGFPRHLSIHVGGMLVMGEPLVDIVPVEPATMPGRVVVQFDKNDVEDLGLIKMDMLGLHPFGGRRDAGAGRALHGHPSRPGRTFPGRRQGL